MLNKISIIVPCYNQAEYLDKCLQSVLNQTFQNWECIIVNDGSKDNTEDKAIEWTKKDNRFIYHLKENGGLSSARNAGIQIAKGEWILPLDADDYIGNEYMELGSKEFENNYTIIYCKAQKFGAVNEYWDLPEFSLDEFYKRNIIFCTAFYKKEIWEIIGGYDESMKLGYEDYDFWLSASNLKDFKVKRIDSIQFFYRTKENSMLKEMGTDKRIQVMDYLFTKHTNKFISVNGTYFQILNQLRTKEIELDKIRNSKKFKLVELFSKYWYKIFN